MSKQLLTNKVAGLEKRDETNFVDNLLLARTSMEEKKAIEAIQEESSHDKLGATIDAENGNESSVDYPATIDEMSPTSLLKS